jgi:isoleucyl-tRNA synthetase
VLPNNKLLGPRWGARFPQLRAALEGADAALVAASVRDGTPLRLEVDGEPVELLPEEILVSTQPAAGLAVAADKLITVAVDATVTPELRAEGQAREIVRRVQDMRKNAGFEIADRITLYYQAQQGLKAVLQQWEAYIRLETLSTEWLESAPPEDAYVEEHKIDGESLTIGVRRNAVVSS